MTGAQNSSDNFKTELRIINPGKPETDRLVVHLDGVGWSPMNRSSDDKKLVIGQYVSANESYLWLLDIETGDKTILTPKTGNEKVSYLVSDGK